MKFIEYKEILQEKNILLFDFDYRNSYKNMFILNETIYNNEQEGGTDKEYYVSPFNLIKNSNYNLSENKISKLIYNLIENNIKGAKYLCKVSNL